VSTQPLWTGAIQRAARAAADTLGRRSRLIRGLRPAYESFLDWSSRGQGIPFTINGVEFRRDPRCRDRFPDEFVYEAPVADLLRNRIGPGQLCFDVGANVGYYVLQLAYWSHPGGKVVAFEPNPEARVILEKHVRLNGFADDVNVVPAAVGALAGTATLYTPGENSGLDGISRLGSPIDLIARSARKVTTPVVTLDEYCEANESIRWITSHLGVVPVINYTGGDRGWIGDNPFIFLETKKIQSTGWKAQLTIREGILRTLKWLQANPWVLENR